MSRRQIAALWRRHMQWTFPVRLRGEQLAGVDVVMLDADIAGCVTTWLGSTGDLDVGRERVLRGCVERLQRLVLALADPGGA
jgi:hypothetical protein